MVCIRLKIILLLLILLYTGCVEEYKIPSKTVENYKEELVVQGRILSGENSVVYISKTYPFGNVEGMGEIITDAEVHIIGQNGYESEKAVYDNLHRHYVINTVDLPQNTLYAVEVVLNGETYQSDFQELQMSPEIDEITYKENVDGISIHVSTHDDEDGQRAYMWSCTEDWEFHSDFDFVGVSGGRVLYNKDVYPIDGWVNPYLYCWGHQESGNIYIYSTAGLKENAVKEHELFRIPVDDIRISYIYSILLKQWSLSDEAYNYFQTLKLYTEDTGGLFAPMPTEIDGNVSCISNPSIKVRGYVLAATVTEKRIFIYESDFKQIRSDYQNCSWLNAQNYPGWERAWMESMEKGNLIIFTQTGIIDQTSISYSKNCFDCRETEGASKKRPDFWPNNHE